MVIILKNIISEGPGSIEDFLMEGSIAYKVIELSDGELPPPMDEFRALIILGGPMSVYEMEDYPHLHIEGRLIREAINRNMQVLGICLGAQLIAHCLGGRVYKGHKEELGWLPIELTTEGIKDPLMRRLALI